LEKIEIYGLKTKIIKPGDDIVQIIIDAINSNSITLDDGDIIVIAETPLAISQNRIVNLHEIIPTKKAKRLAKKYDMDPRIVQVILNESDHIFGGVRGFLLTEKNGFLYANAGVDRSNSPPGTVSLLPSDPQRSADLIRKRLEQYFNKKLAVIIADSRTQPLKKGVIGGAIAVSGMEPVENCRNKPDLYGYRLKYTFRAIADDISSVAQLLLGETNEQTPVIIVKGVKIKITENPKESMFIPYDNCIFMNILRKKPKKI